MTRVAAGRVGFGAPAGANRSSCRRVAPAFRAVGRISPDRKALAPTAARTTRPALRAPERFQRRWNCTRHGHPALSPAPRHSPSAAPSCLTAAMQPQVRTRPGRSPKPVAASCLTAAMQPQVRTRPGGQCPKRSRRAQARCTRRAQPPTRCPSEKSWMPDATRERGAVLQYCPRSRVASVAARSATR